MKKPLKTATICLAVCVSLDGRPQAPAQTGTPQPGQTNSPQPAVPPEVDQALRARVNEYYQDLMAGKYRAADNLVAEDSKDLFIAMNKPRIKGVEIIKIDYSENFTKAAVALLCPGEWYFRGKAFPVKIPIHDVWKVEGGQWFWYAVPEKNVVHLPSGITVHIRDEDVGTGEATPPALKDPKAAAIAILNLVSLDRNTVALKINRKDSAAVSIKNGMPGSVELSVQSNAAVKGFSMRLDKDKLAAGETARLILNTEGNDFTTAPADVKVNVVVQPIGRVLPVSVKFLLAEPETAAAPSSQAAKETKNK